MAKLVQLIVNKNCTALNGTVLRLVEQEPDAKNKTSEEDEYDAVGAMQFIVVTVFVYSIFGVFCTLITKIKRSHGKSQRNAMIDESVTKYLKRENSLKFDGQKTKLRFACEKMAQQVEEFEEKEALFDNEGELSSEFTHANSPYVSRKKQKKKKRKKRRERDRTDFVRNMDVECIVHESGVIDGTTDGQADTNLADISEKEICDSLESLNETENASPPKVLETSI